MPSKTEPKWMQDLRWGAEGASEYAKPRNYYRYVAGKTDEQLVAMQEHLTANRYKADVNQGAVAAELRIVTLELKRRGITP